MQIPCELPYLFSWEIFPAPVPWKSTVDGSKISEGKFGSLFQAIFLAKYVDKCFDKFCPSRQKVDKKRNSTIQKRTCRTGGKYYTTIEAMNSHKRSCDRYEDETDDEELEEDEGEENEEGHIEVDFIGDDKDYEDIYL